MTKRQIVSYLNDSALMRSVRSGTIEQLRAYQSQLLVQIRTRKAASRQTFALTALFSLIGFATGALITRISGTPAIVCFIVCQIAGYIYWKAVYGARHSKAKKMEKIMIAVIETVIAEKLAGAPLPQKEADYGRKCKI